MNNCPAKVGLECAIVNTEVGFAVHVGEKSCDECFAKGGVSPTNEFRKSFTQNAIDAAMRRPELLSEAQRQNFAKIHNVTLTVTAPSKSDRWSKVRPSWEMAASFAKAKLSGFGGREATEEVISQRKLSCFGDPSTNTPPCSALSLSKDGEHHFCNDCGCGDREIAYLDGGKLNYPYLECPRQRKGFSNESAIQYDVIFDCTTGGGIGDIVTHCWHAEGLKAQNKRAAFHTNSEDVKSVLSIFGQEWTDAVGGSILKVGGDSPGNKYEYSTDKGTNPRAVSWATTIPGNPTPIRPKTIIPLDEVKEAKKLYEENAYFQGKKVVMMFPFAEWNPRRWPLAYWLDLATYLHHDGYAIHMLAPKSKMTTGELGSLPWVYYEYTAKWPRIMAYMQQAALVIGNDSGPAHISSTMDVPTLALMGGTKNIFTYYGGIEMKADTPCVGCHFDPVKGFRPACDQQCRALMDLKPEDVRVAAKAIMNPTGSQA